MYIRFFNGRTWPNYTLQIIEGPIVGPIEITYFHEITFNQGEIRIHNSENQSDYKPIPIIEKGFIYIEGRYYPNFEILDDNNPLIRQYRKEKRRFLNYKEFFKILPQKENQ